MIPFEGVLPQGSEFKCIASDEWDAQKQALFEQPLILQCGKIDRKTLSFVVSSLGRKGGPAGCIILRYDHPHVCTNESISFSENRHTIINIAIDKRFAGLYLENLLLYIVSYKTYYEAVATLYVDHPSLSDIDFFINLGFIPNCSSRSTDSDTYWSNEPSPETAGYSILVKTNALMNPFRQKNTPSGTNRSPYTWYSNNWKLYTLLRKKIKKSFVKLPDSELVKYPDPFDQ